MECKHKQKLPLYARQQKDNGRWISTQKIKGKMIYVCMICKKLLEEELVEVRI